MEPWFGLSPATMIYNEAIAGGWLKQPANAWTNVFYLLNALALFVFYIKDRKRQLALTFGVISFLIGLSSFLYHASNTFFFQYFDLASMYLLSGLLAALVLVRLGFVQPRRWLIVFLSVFAGSSVLLFIIRGKSGAIIFGIEVILILLLEGRTRMKSRRKTLYRNLLYALALFVVSFVFWVLDYNGLIFSPGNHLIQGHGLWHILNSFCFVFLYLFYRQFDKKEIGL
ncbi:MAG: ceramidase domain-containing protein [Deltaproteobacteria bacterium]|nr:ceramidase domain-containing protein [Deltaproteobacteria bacterium]